MFKADSMYSLLLCSDNSARILHRQRIHTFLFICAVPSIPVPNSVSAPTCTFSFINCWHIPLHSCLVLARKR